MKIKHYTKTANLYDEIYKEKDYKGEVEFIETLIKKRFGNSKDINVLDMGCGSGNHLKLLSKKYKNLFGVDPNKNLLEIASKKVNNASFYQGEMSNYSNPRRFDLILCLFSTIHYNYNLKLLETTLKKFYENLRYGGFAIIDFISLKRLKKSVHSEKIFNNFKSYFENIPHKNTSTYKITTYINNEKIIEEANLGMFKIKDIINTVKKIGFRYEIKYITERKNKYYLLLYKDDLSIKPNNEKPTNSIVISLTNRCNFHCLYCFQNSGNGNIMKEINAKQVKNILKKFKKPFVNNYVQFTGGEPMIRKDFFEILSYALSLRYIIRFSTNGLTLNKLNDSKLKILKSPNIFIKISLDGSNVHYHEKYRDKNSFNEILSGLKKLRFYNKNIGIKSVISEYNINDIENTLKFCRKFNIKSYTYNILRFEGRAINKNIQTVNHFDVFKKIFNILAKHPEYNKLLFSSDFVSIVLCYFIKNYSIQNKYYFFINHDGKVYPSQVLQDKELILGDISDRINFNLDSLNNLNLKEKLIFKKCLKCKTFNYCNNRIFNTPQKKINACKDFKKIINFIDLNKSSKVFKNVLNEFKLNYK